MLFCHFFKLMHEITVHELLSLDKKINDSDLAHKFGVMTNKILYSAKKKAAFTTTRVKNQLQRTVLLLTTPHHPINFVLEKKKKE